MTTPMTADIEIWHTVKVVLAEHGDDALVHAATMADQLFDDGDLSGWAVWMKVLEAIEDFHNAEPSGPLH